MKTNRTSRGTAWMGVAALGLMGFGPCVPSADPGTGGGGSPPTSTSTPTSKPFQPAFHVTFAGAEGAAVGTIKPAVGGHVYTTFDGGFGASFSAAQTRGGRATSAELSIKEGSDGNPPDGAGMGDFGMYVGLPSSLVAFDGDTMHVGVWIYVPQDFSFETNTGILKFFRWTPHKEGDNTQSSNGRLDTLIMQGSDYWNWDLGSSVTAPPGTQTGWAMGNEFNHAAEPNAFPTKRILPLSEWSYVEMMVKFTTNPAEQLRRVWVNDQFAAEFAGDTTKYYDTTGTLVTRKKPAVETITPGYGCPGFLLFTYWNGNAPGDQSVWVDAIAIHKGESDLPAKDELGNPMMGMANVGPDGD